MLGDDGAVTLHTGYNDSSNPFWDVTAAKNNSTNFQVLFEGTGGPLEGLNIVWTTDTNGAYLSDSGWLTDAEATSNGYESIFNVDLNKNGVIDL